jgi:hypothetical protein
VVALRIVAVVPFDVGSGDCLRLSRDCPENADVDGALTVANARLVSTAELSNASCTQLLLDTPQWKRGVDSSIRGCCDRDLKVAPLVRLAAACGGRASIEGQRYLVLRTRRSGGKWDESSDTSHVQNAQVLYHELGQIAMLAMQ